MNDKKINRALHITDLVAKHLKGQITIKEAKELTAWIEQSAENRSLFEQLTNEERLTRIHQSFSKIDTESALKKIKEKKFALDTESPKPSIKLKYGFWKYAAAALIFLSIGIYFQLKHADEPNNNVVKNDLLPGSNKAILTLSNGRKLSITDAKSGVIAKDANLVVKKKADGSISYESDAAANNSSEPAFQTISTPRGGQWPAIELPDGTKVTLDAGSSITYPITFSGSERKVSVTGQVYFNVKHDATKPFRVTVKGETIEDIGTEFNVNAFDDETAIRITLIEGSASVSNNNHRVVLIQGQQAVDAGNADAIRLRKANIAEVVAWKNGLFHFDHADLKTVMRQISRWYDVEVVYEGEIPKTDITGEVYRSMKASQVFEVLNNLKVNFRIEGKKIIVTDKN